jgi:hypothetical protein
MRELDRQRAHGLPADLRRHHHHRGERELAGVTARPRTLAFTAVLDAQRIAGRDHLEARHVVHQAVVAGQPLQRRAQVEGGAHRAVQDV